MISLSSLNFLQIFIAGMASFILGIIWYSPMLFGNIWMRLSGLTKQKISKTKNMPLRFISAFISGLIQSIVLSMIILTINISQFSEIFNLNILFWLAFVLPIYLGRMIWMNSPFKLFLIDSIYHFLNIFSISLILFYF